MTESFDPYRQWLDIDEPERPLDHYRLLGLPRFESNRGEIAHAADIAMAKVRKIRPGQHVAEWGRLLDQLGAAKVCLLDPNSKAAYDASLRSGGVAAQPSPATTPPAESTQPRVATPPTMGTAPPGTGGSPSPLGEQGKPAPTPEAGPTGGPATNVGGSGTTPTHSPHSLPPLPQPGVTQGSVLAHAQFDSPWSSTPAPMAPGSPMTVQPGQPANRPLPVATAIPTAGSGSDSLSSAFPGAGSQPGPFESAPTPGTPSGGTASPRDPRPQKRSLQQQLPTLAAIVLGCVVVVLATMLLTQDGRHRDAPGEPPVSTPKQPTTEINVAEPPSPPSATDRPASPMGQPAVPPDRTAPDDQPAAQPAKPAEAPAPDDAPTPDDAPVPDGAPESGGVPESEDMPVTPQPGGQETVEEGDAPTETEGPPPARDGGMVGAPGDMGDAEPPGSAEAPTMDPLEHPAQSSSDSPTGRGATFQLAIGNTRFSMAERDLVGARAHLDLAKRLATTDQQKQAAERVSLVLEHLDEFWRGMHKAAGALQSGQTLAVKDSFVVVVEASPERLLIRASGRNMPFRVDELPGALVMAVAESWFDNTPSSKLLLGTFLAFDANGREDMGRQYLDHAARGGLDVKPFLAELAAGGSGPTVGQTRTREGNSPPGDGAPANPKHPGRSPRR